MPSSLTIDITSINALKEAVENILGYTIASKPNCEALSKDLLKTTGCNISSQTIRRMWKLVEDNTTPSFYTLNTLSQYVGYSDWQDFLQKRSNQPKEDQTVNLGLLKTFYERPHMQGLDVSRWYWGVNHHFSEFILTNQQIFNEFIKKMHRNNDAMEYVLSYNPMYDNLAKDWYLTGINLLTQNTNVSHLKIFGKAIHFLSKYLTEDIAQCEPLLNTMFQLRPLMQEEYGCVYFPEARIIGSSVLYGKLQNDDALQNKWIDVAYQILGQVHSKTIGHQDDFLFTLSDYLNLAERYDIAYSLHKEFSREYKSIQGHWGYDVSVQISRATTLFFYNPDIANKLFKSIDLKELRFEHRLYYTIQYHLLELGLCRATAIKRRQKIKERIDSLILESGLTQFKNLINRFE